MNCRREYIEEKGYSYLNNNVLNEYALWLEQKLTETNQALQLQEPDISKSVCNYCLEWVDELPDKFGCKECIEKHK